MKPKRLRPVPVAADPIGMVVRDVRDEAAFLGARLPDLAARLNSLPTPRQAAPRGSPASAPTGAPAAVALAAAGGPRWRSRATRGAVAAYIRLWETYPTLRPMLAAARRTAAPVAHGFEWLRHGGRGGAPVQPRGRWRSGPALAAIALYDRLWNAHPRNRQVLHAARRAAAPLFKVVELFASRRRA